MYIRGRDRIMASDGRATDVRGHVIEHEHREAEEHAEIPVGRGTGSRGDARQGGGAV